MVGSKTVLQPATPPICGHSPKQKPLTRTVTAADNHLASKAARFAAAEIAFIDHPDFRKRNGHALVEAQRPAETVPTRCIRSTGPGIAFLPEFARATLLTPEQERYLFLKMNFLRFRAEQMRRKLRPTQPDPALVAAIESQLSEAQAIRNQIGEANVRLVVATAKKLCHSFDQLGDLIGEGVVPLLRAIDLFDVGLGYRFSTYATWAIRNRMIRVLQRQRSSRELPLTDEQAACHHLAVECPIAPPDETAPQQRKGLVSRLLTALNEREQRILRARFGLDGEPSGQSLSDISVQIGLSKERIRQVVLTALGKLRKQAEANGYDIDNDLIDA